MTDLSAYAALSKRVAPLTSDDDLTLSVSDFPAELPDHTPFDGLVLDPGYARNLGWAGEDDLPFGIVDRIRGFEAYAEPEGFRRIGLWLMHLLLSGRDWAGLTLTHPTNRIATFYAHIQHPLPRDHNLKPDGRLRYKSYEYWPQEVWRHPFADATMSPVHRVEEQDRPFFAYGWSSDDFADQGDVSKVDQIIFEATPEGIAAMACVLMDMAHPDLGRDEINIEAPHIGFAATQPRSIEARFWLPNSFAFNCDTLDALVLPPLR